MAIRKIVTEGDELLTKKCREVTEINDRILDLLDDMKETMYKANGVGLAAPQVGILRRIAVVDIGEGVFELINPVITEAKGEQQESEGCLSVPGIYGITSRPYEVTVKALNRNGEEIEIQAEGFLARAFCHEIDHLDGILFRNHVIEYHEVEDEE